MKFHCFKKTFILLSYFKFFDAFEVPFDGATYRFHSKTIRRVAKVRTLVNCKKIGKGASWERPRFLQQVLRDIDFGGFEEQESIMAIAYFEQVD